MEQADGKDYRGQFNLRFTIGSDDPRILAHWEPGAPPFEERMHCLRHAHERGFTTSVSCEPMLDPANLPRLIERLRLFTKESIWVGKMNCPERVRMDTIDDLVELARVQYASRDEELWKLWDQLHGDPLIRWKESVREVFEKGRKA
jgi:DNA repair photolyase